MERRLRHALLLVGGILSLLLGYMVVLYIGAFALGVFVYYATRPVYRWLTRHKLNETIAALVAPLVFLIPALLLVAYTIRIITIEARALAIQAGDSIFAVVDEEILEQVLEDEIPEVFPTPQELRRIEFTEISQFVDELDAEFIESIIDLLMEAGLSIVSSLSGLFFTLFIAFSLAFYLLRDGTVLKKKVFNLTRYDRTVTEYAKTVDNDLEVVFFGNILLAIITGVLGAITFTLLAFFAPGGHILAYPALIGILCGITSLIPVIGMKLVYWPVTLVLIGTSISNAGMSPEAFVFPTLFFIVGFIIVDTIPDLIARPYIGSRGGISTGLLLFSYILGPLTFGWYGLFLGPLIFVAFYEFVNIILPTLVREIRR